MATVYEMPKEPGTGTILIDKHQLVWRRDRNEDYGVWWRETTSGITKRWHELLAFCGPLTNVEVDGG